MIGDILAHLRPGKVWSGSPELGIEHIRFEDPADKPTQEEIDAAAPVVQTQRTRRGIKQRIVEELRATDHLGLPDHPLYAGWKAYRAALYALINHATPEGQVFPDRPTQKIPP